MGREQRLPFLELFDVSNLEDDGSLVKIGSKRHDMSKVRIMNGELKLTANLFSHRGMVSTTWTHHLVNAPLGLNQWSLFSFVHHTVFVSL